MSAAKAKPEWASKEGAILRASDSHRLAELSDRALLRIAISSTENDGDDVEIPAALDCVIDHLETLWWTVNDDHTIAGGINAAQSRLRVIAALLRRGEGDDGNGPLPRLVGALHSGDLRTIAIALEDEARSRIDDVAKRTRAAVADKLRDASRFLSEETTNPAAARALVEAAAIVGAECEADELSLISARGMLDVAIEFKRLAPPRG